MKRFMVRTREGAFIGMIALSLVWGINWLVMKFALRDADPVTFNIQRILVAIATLFVVLVWLRRPLLPQSWVAVAVTGLFQTTLNMGATTMALAGGGAGRTSVLVFTMPFWTVLLAWPVLNERVRGVQWFAVAFAFAGMALVVEPWNWHGSLAPKLWAVASGFGWAAGTISIKYFERDRKFDMVNFMAWQMVIGTLPFMALPLVYTLSPVHWSLAYVAALLFTGAISTALGFVIWISVLRMVPAGTASLNTLAVPVVALLASMAVFGERLSLLEWSGIACINVGLVLVSLGAWRHNRRERRAADEPPPIEGS
jgi:drug/metabolite transporter (DMT)-like permease